MAPLRPLNFMETSFVVIPRIRYAAGFEKHVPAGFRLI
jgi:hypothetical protein